MTRGHAVAAVLAAAALAAPAPAFADNEQVRATASAVTVSGTTDAGGTLEAYALRPDQDVSAWQQEQPVASTPAGGHYTLSVPRHALADRLYAKYVVVSRPASGPPTVVGGPRHVDEFDFAAKADFPFPAPPTKKGLQVQDVADAQELGTGHAAINVAFDQLMYERPEGTADAVPFESGGRTYWFRGAYLDALDRQIRPLSDDGVLVNLILILYDTQRPNSAIEHLLHPDAARGQGSVYAFNTKTEDGIAYFTAAMELLTERYTRPDQRHGRAVGYIVGNEVDSAWVWQNMGEQPVERFVEYYGRALRIASLAARKAYEHARVYVSLDHMWAAPYREAEPTRYYAGREILDRLAALGRAEGDFDWHVAQHPYPEDLFEPDFWNDTTATEDFDTARVTFKNLEVLPAYLRTAPMTYRGAPRRIILSEQGFHTPPGADGERLQAAAYAFAYYKVAFLDEIDSFILHRHVDHQQEGGLLLGLRRWDSGRFEASAPGVRKLAYDVFRGIDTERSLALTEFAKPIVGIDDWAEVVPRFDAARLARRLESWRAGVRVADRLTGAFAPAGRWEAAENVVSASPVAGGVVELRFDAEATLWRGAQWRLPRSLDVSRTPWLSATIRVPQAPAGTFRPDARFEVKLKAYGADGRVAEGLAEVRPGANARLALDLSGWPGRYRLTRVKAWVRSTTNDDWAGTLEVGALRLARRAERAVPNLEVEAALDRPAAGGTLTLTVRNHDARTLGGALQLAACDGVATARSTVRLGRVEPGQTLRLTVPVTRFAPADPRWPRVCATYRRDALRLVADVPDPTGERALPAAIAPLFNFEDGIAGWTAGENVTGVASATGMANAPGRPRLGEHALDATSAAVPASAWRSVRAVPAQPLDLSGARSVFAFVDSYGGAPGASGYEARITLRASDGTSRSATARIAADAWNRVTVGVGDWSSRGAVTELEVGFRAIGRDTPWAPHFQVDFAGSLR